MDALQAIASPRKREILRVLWSQERTAGDVHRALGDVTFGAVSQHLRSLQRAGLLTRRQEGRNCYYRAVPSAAGELAPFLEAMWSSALSELARRAELEEARRGPRPRSARLRKAGRGPAFTPRSTTRRAR